MYMLSLVKYLPIGVDDLLQAFRTIQSDEVHLLIAGKRSRITILAVTSTMIRIFIHIFILLKMTSIPIILMPLIRLSCHTNRLPLQAVPSWHCHFANRL